MKICCLADLHGTLPKVPECDLLLLGGDYCPSSKPVHMVKFMAGPFRLWLEEQSKRFPVIGIAGNHDLLFEWPTFEGIDQLSWKYLQDTSVTHQGIKIYGTPHTPRFWDWAFNLDEDELVKKWALIPDDTDILIVHGPPRGFGDWVPKDKVNTGSPGLLERIKKVKPRLVVCGHIHAGYGQYKIGKTLVVNSSLMDEAYQPVNPPQVVEIDLP